MMYWDKVLKEVLNKEDPTLECAFTCVKDRAQAAAKMVREVAPASCTKKPRPRSKKYLLGDKYPTVYFTEREAQTIFHLLHGKTIAEVGIILKLSLRTIEFYVKNMKIKLNCRLKSELICKVIHSDFMQQADGSWSVD